VISGGMYAGKSSELIRRIERARIARVAVQVFKSHLDTRYAGPKALSTHSGKDIDGVYPIAGAADIRRLLDPMVNVIAVDEAQFLDDDIVPCLSSLAGEGYRVIVAGISTDFRGLPFGPMPELMAIADDVTVLKAICVVCGDEAIRTQRLIHGQPARFDSPQILVGSADSYEARCRHCHTVLQAETHDQQGRTLTPDFRPRSEAVSASSGDVTRREPEAK